MSSLLKPHHWRRALAVAGALLLIVPSGTGPSSELQAKMAARPARPTLGLRGLVEKHDFLPHAAARHPEVQHLLRTPGDVPCARA
jgi:C4-dicarboxylate-specific signal transduction histidine kinase